MCNESGRSPNELSVTNQFSESEFESKVFHCQKPGTCGAESPKLDKQRMKEEVVFACSINQLGLKEKRCRTRREKQNVLEETRSRTTVVKELRNIEKHHAYKKSLRVADKKRLYVARKKINMKRRQQQQEEEEVQGEMAERHSRQRHRVPLIQSSLSLYKT